nr:ATP synthase subunit b-like [Aegilops tauschii subsp. strangulata]
MAVGFKDGQDKYGKRWKHIEGECKAQDIADRQLKEKAEELRTWYNSRSRELRSQEEKMAATEEKARAHDGKMTEREGQLNAKAKDLAAQEQAMVATLRSKDEGIEELVRQQTQKLEDDHQKALEAQASEHAVELKEAVDEAAVATIAKAETEA